MLQHLARSWQRPIAYYRRLSLHPGASIPTLHLRSHKSNFSYSTRTSILKHILRRKRSKSDTETERNMADFGKPDSVPDYGQWSHNDLVQRVLELEKSMAAYAGQQKKIQDAYDATSSTPKKTKKPFDHLQYSTRLIALKFAYIGTPYQGFEYHVGGTTALPTVEEKLFEALLKARLVPPKAQTRKNAAGEAEADDSIDFAVGGKGRTDVIEGGVGRWVDVEAWNYTKCGRTDRGVSAFGQVVGVRVRSARKIRKTKHEPEPLDADEPSDHEGLPGVPVSKEEVPFDDETDELPYIQILNKLLPPTIRILAWCPNVPPSFSARFNCRSRTYHYFFTNPSIPPRPGVITTNLDIKAMNEAADQYIGLHDFRSLCKVDASKQITNFMRRVVSSSIEKVDAGAASIGGVMQPEMYYFRLKGSAFLWHQVRHMIAVLFLVGQGLEHPSIVSQLLDVSSLQRKPLYEMADDRPLVLWDCEFDENEVQWIYGVMDDAGPGSREDVIGSIWEMWHTSTLDVTLTGSLLGMMYKQQEDKIGKVQTARKEEEEEKRRKFPVIVNGTSSPRCLGQYVPLLNRERLETVDVLNKRFADRKGEEWSKRWGADNRKQWASNQTLDDGSE